MAAKDLPPPNDTTDMAVEDDDDDDDELFGTNDDLHPKTDDGGSAVEITDSATVDAAATISTRRMLEANPPPRPLPPGWFLKPSRSSPSNHYYFNQDTGECRWEHPVGSAVGGGSGAGEGGRNEASPVSRESLNATAAAAAAAVKSILKRSNSGPIEEVAVAGAGSGHDATTAHHHRKPSPPPPRKRVKTVDPRERKEREHRGGSGSGGSGRERREHHRHHHSPSSSGGEGGGPKEVRVLHILKKHRGSRRPASWRNPRITDSKEKAVTDLRELISILNQSGGSSGGDRKEMRATFEELARTESDCSSAKRGGDLGFFGRKKMQPAFEKASFGLRVGQLSDVVDTSSGVHVILRLA